MKLRIVVPIVAASLAAALVFPLANAGTSEDPEITDPNNDGGPNGLDIVKVWFSNDETTLNATIQLTANPPPVGAFAMHNRFVIWTKPTAGLPGGKATLYYVLRLSVGSGTGNAGQTTINGGYGFSPTVGTYDGPANEPAVATTVSGSTYKMALPLAVLKGFTPGVDSLKEIYAQAVLMSTGTTNGDTTSMNLVHRVWDRAPNTGFGRDYLSAGATVAGGTPQVNLTAEPSALSAAPGANASFTVSAMNAGADAVNLTLNATGDLDVAFHENGTLAVPGGGNASANATITVPSDALANATYNVTVHASVDGVEVGNVTITVTVTAPAPVEAGNATQTPANETAGAADTTKDGGIPGFEAVAFGLAVAVAAIFVRRKKT